MEGDINTLVQAVRDWSGETVVEAKNIEGLAFAFAMDPALAEAFATLVDRKRRELATDRLK